MDALQIATVTKLADLESEITELESLLSQNLTSDKRDLWKRDLTKLRAQYTKLKNKLDSDLERTDTLERQRTI